MLLLFFKIIIVIVVVVVMLLFLFPGGDQMKIVYSFFNEEPRVRVPSDALIAIKETLMATGGVVSGSSAGTDCQTSKIMITGGNSYEGLITGTKLGWHMPSERYLLTFITKFCDFSILANFFHL